MYEYDNQALTTHAKKRKNKKEEHSRKNKRTSKEGPLTTHVLVRTPCERMSEEERMEG